MLTKSSAIAISIGENVLVNELVNNIPKYTDTISPQLVIDNGALGLDKLTDSPAEFLRLRQVYCKAISATMVYATVTICASLLPALGMRWLNLKRVSREREAAEQVIESHVEEKKSDTAEPAASNMAGNVAPSEKSRIAHEVSCISAS